MKPCARRIDCFSEWTGTAAFGEKMKEQVEERLRFYEEGIAPTKNTTAMQVRPAIFTVACLTSTTPYPAERAAHTFVSMPSSLPTRVVLGVSGVCV